MKKFDKFLEFLFHSKRGIGALMGSALLCMMIFSGCYADCLACACEKTNCPEGAGCWDNCENECDRNCSGDCAVGNCLFGDGCTAESEDCTLVCGGCNRTMWTDCGMTCNGGAGSCECGVCNFTCDQAYGDKNNVTVRWFCTLPDGTWSGKLELTKKGLSSTVSLPDWSNSNSELSFSEWEKYFELKGFYSVADEEDMVVDVDGNVLDAKALTASREVSLFTKFKEKMRGETVTVTFTNDYPESFYLNNMKIKVGAKIDHLRLPSLPGRTFLGWKVAGTQNAPVMVREGDEFHFYTFRAELSDTIELTPVFAE